MKLERYISEMYSNNPYWFAEEVQQAHHISRISKVLDNKNYLNGRHKILEKEDSKYKDKELITAKTVLQTAKSIIKFHNSYIIGKRPNLSGSDNMVAEYNKVFRRGKFNLINYKIVDDLNCYGDAFEYVYYNNGRITSKLIESSDGFPVYDDEGEYIAFIEHWTDSLSNISYYYIYTDNKVDKWTNLGGNYILEESAINLTGLPIHYINGENKENELFGRSILDDIRPILDRIEYLLNKMDDAITVLSLNPIAYTSGQHIEGTISADTVGHLLSLEDGDFKYAVANLDSASIKLLYDALIQNLQMVASVPSIAFGQTNIANVSEVSLKLIYQNIDNHARQVEVYLRDGLNERFDKIERLLNKQGITFNAEDYVDVEFNYNRPIDTSEVIDQLSKQYNDGAMSRRTYIEKSTLTTDVDIELQRIEEEGNKNTVE
ncbi:phage portal protein [Tissierella carlieri]|uniref:phage portal protein n=1 Tax=Tissierella carlieri TaxID=689904 RepID=UPI001C11B88B|nr:phage portal protein [Tissierella carlieri]MBU5311058.1 phage portal protein [Tissierella carlieri]